jgi:uncharacterized protein (DUF885 family)
MKKIVLCLLTGILFCACESKPKNNEELNTLFENYYQERLKFFPLEATSQGDTSLNDQLPIDISETYRKNLLGFYQKYSAALDNFSENQLNEEEKVFYSTLRFSINTEIEGLSFPKHLIPFNQFDGLPLTMAQLGSGQSAQPFKTKKDYENWLKRMDQFSAWGDSAIVNFRKGMKEGWILPKALVLKMIPQMQEIGGKKTEESIFYEPIKNLPANFSSAEKQEITAKYTKAIAEKINPTYLKLGAFLENEYLKVSRPTSGVMFMQNGKKYYDYQTYYWTTTLKTPAEIFQIGLSEVDRIKAEMEKVKTQVGFKGSLLAFFENVKKDPKLMPFKTSNEVLDAFRKIQAKIEPNLDKMFALRPKTKFEIRQTEAFREATASAEYLQGTADGSRPGVFYVPIPDPKSFNLTSGMESLFLHEAIPGHHYQVSLQQENQSIPKFMRFSWYGAYGEGWALYTESLGKELGLYTDPYQYLGALGDEMHRAIRLVVDVGMHTKGWSREEAIKYMMSNEAISEQGAVAEIERYMALPGQALSYKIGALKIRELRTIYTQSLGSAFKLADFHSEVLKNGCLPLEVLETNLQAWADKIKPSGNKK